LDVANAQPSRSEAALTSKANRSGEGLGAWREAQKTSRARLPKKMKKKPTRFLSDIPPLGLDRA
jgi:hypothetical protein